MTDTKVYTINGKEYHSLDEIPEQYRTSLSDENLEKLREGGFLERYEIDGITYHSYEEIPDKYKKHIPKDIAQHLKNNDLEKSHPGKFGQPIRTMGRATISNFSREEILLMTPQFTKPLYLLSLAESVLLNYLLGITLGFESITVDWRIALLFSVIVGHLSYGLGILIFDKELLELRSDGANPHRKKMLPAIFVCNLFSNFFYHITLYAISMLI